MTLQTSQPIAMQSMSVKRHVPSVPSEAEISDGPAPVKTGIRPPTRFAMAPKPPSVWTVAASAKIVASTVPIIANCFR